MFSVTLVAPRLWWHDIYRKSYSDNSSSKKVLWQLVVPKAHRSRALAGCHDDVGHQGRMRTLSL